MSVYVLHSFYGGRRFERKKMSCFLFLLFFAAPFPPPSPSPPFLLNTSVEPVVSCTVDGYGIFLFKACVQT